MNFKRNVVRLSHKRAFLSHVAKRAGVNKKVVQKIFDSILALMEEDTKVCIPGFGTFTPEIHEAHYCADNFLLAYRGIPGKRKIHFAMNVPLKALWTFKDAPPNKPFDPEMMKVRAANEKRWRKARLERAIATLHNLVKEDEKEEGNDG